MGAAAECRFGMPIAVSMGDPAGIGLELCIKAWMERGKHNLPPFVLYADPEALEERSRLLGLPIPLQVIGAPSEAAAVFATALPVRRVPLAVPAIPGAPNPANAGAVIAAIQQATDAVLSGETMALVTNPIAKSVLTASGFTYTGHTDFLAALAQGQFPNQQFNPVMMLASRELRVVPLTIHIPLAEVPRSITRASIMNTARITYESLQRDFAIAAPRVAIAGLNPHAGEDGTIGDEERNVIAPAIAALRSQGLSVTGPFPADTLFHPSARGSYDAVIAMYHDQALIPFKTIAFDHGVNVTLGLPFVRTSPDHGTAFDIAAQVRASPNSLIESLRLAVRIAAARAATVQR